MSGATDLWAFECPRGCGDFDVWGDEYVESDPQLVWAWSFHHASVPFVRFVPESIRHTRCPTCGAQGVTTGRYES